MELNKRIKNYINSKTINTTQPHGMELIPRTAKGPGLQKLWINMLAALRCQRAPIKGSSQFAKFVFPLARLGWQTWVAISIRLISEVCL